MDDKQLILDWFKSHKIKISDDQLNSLVGYVDMVIEYSPRLNLVSKSDLPDIIDRHLLDSLYALTVYNIPHDVRACDLGSGAGFPGIPIAIARPDIHMYLIESRRRKGLFLSKAINSIGLANAIVINERWENISLLYDVVFTRAVLSEKDIRERILPRLNPEGVVLYYSKYNEIKILRE